MLDVLFPATLGKLLENGLTPFFEHLAHFGGKVEIRLEPKRTRNVVEEGSFDRNRIYNVLPEKHTAELFGHPDAVVQSCLGMLRTVERNQNVFDHGLLQSPNQAKTATINSLR